jgi:hypothetical protein
MPRRSGASSSGTGSISVGHSIQGSAVNTGNKAVLTVSSISETPAVEEQTEVLTVLRLISRELQALNGRDADDAKRELQSAIEAASSSTPDKTVIGVALSKAIDAAKKTAEFTVAAAKVAPLLQSAVQWLGTEWAHLTISKI